MIFHSFSETKKPFLSVISVENRAENSRSPKIERRHSSEIGTGGERKTDGMDGRSKQKSGGKKVSAEMLVQCPRLRGKLWMLWTQKTMSFRRRPEGQHATLVSNFSTRKKLYPLCRSETVRNHARGKEYLEVKELFSRTWTQKPTAARQFGMKAWSYREKAPPKNRDYQQKRKAVAMRIGISAGLSEARENKNKSACLLWALRDPFQFWLATKKGINPKM